MPTNKNNYFIPLLIHGERKNDVKSVHSLGKSIESNIIENDIPDGFSEIENNITKGFTLDVGEISADGLTKIDLFFVFACGYDFEKLKQNNFRKFHGLPLKRRKWL